MVKKIKTLIPNDLRDFLSIISFTGFVAIFLAFSFNILFLSNSMDAIFLTVGGLGFMVIGKAFSIRQWVKDGIQRNETIQILAIVVGISSIVIGILLFANVTIPERFLGYVGIVALFPAVFTMIDYIVKNRWKK